MKKFLLFITITIITLGLASLVVYQFFDINNYKPNIISYVKEKTGQQIYINGDVRLRILPYITLDIKDVSVGSNESEAPIKADSAILQLKLIGLLRKEIDVSSLKLVNPIVKFRIFKDGSNNFSQGVTTGNPAEKPSKEAIPALDNYNSARQFINSHIVDKLKLSGFEIENGKLRFSDERTAIDSHVDDIFCQTSLLPGNNLFKISGQVKLDLGINQPFTISGQYQLAEDFYDFSEVAFKLGDIEAHGEAGFDYRTNSPDMKVAFYFENINLNPYSGLINLLASFKNASQEDKNVKVGDTIKEPLSWSSKPMDFSFLRDINGHLSFKSNSFIYKDINIGVITLNTYFMNGKMTVSLKEAETLGGNIDGELVVDATSSIYKFRNKINLEAVDFGKLPAEAGILTNISGRASGSILLTSRGFSQQEIVSNIDGSMSLKFEDGFIKNIDLQGMAKNITSAFFVGKDPEQKTEFKELSGDFDVKNGTIRGDNLILKSELIDFNGSGVVNMPQLTVNFKMMPKDRSGKGEVDAPILISGNLLDPSWHLEAQAPEQDMPKKQKGKENPVPQIKRNPEIMKNNVNDSVKGNNQDGSSGIINDIKKIFNAF